MSSQDGSEHACDWCGNHAPNGYYPEDSNDRVCEDCSESAEESPSCRNCDKPISCGQYCSHICEDMAKLPAPADDQKLFTTNRSSQGVERK